MNSFPAQYPGICDACEHRIEPGQQVERAPRGVIRVGTEYEHARGTCPDDPDATADQAALKAGRCARCGLNHPGEC